MTKKLGRIPNPLLLKKRQVFVDTLTGKRCPPPRGCGKWLDIEFYRLRSAKYKDNHRVYRNPICFSCERIESKRIAKEQYAKKKGKTTHGSHNDNGTESAD